MSTVHVSLGARFYGMSLIKDYVSFLRIGLVMHSLFKRQNSGVAFSVIRMVGQ